MTLDSPADTARAGDRILVVDDAEAKRAWMVALLKHLGHQVIEAADGQEALSRLDRSIGGIITDINMPTMDGVTMIHHIRTRGPSEMKILAVSAGSDARSADLSLTSGASVGADAILYMPCSPETFMGAVTKLLAAG